MDVYQSRTADGDNVRQYSDTDCTCQQWTLSQNRDGTYDITTVNSGKCMEVVDADYTEGANVQQWDTAAIRASAGGSSKTATARIV